MLARTLQDLFKRYRRPGDIVFAFVFLTFAVFLFSQIGEQTKITKRTKWFAQPGLWPTISISGMVFFGALHYLSSVLSPRIPGRGREVAFWLRSLEFVAYFLIYVVTVPMLGYLPSTVLFAVFLTLRCGFHSTANIGLAILFAFCVSVLFRGLLQVKIPAGRLYDYLPDSIRVFALTYL
ncbi:tripartite tricarboxylate transporter TctB family protein [uncultured Roseobacter sp.]|uniref:tripartite tricarboxylate transporter TctB family protein n=1 Tax=uncultured Roseobacter sp. TaxID=114847 RepID=UPI002621142E|nr:tripartite tricarboxylate transporter TctB family protein [uncultured Roseobacter sp.]